MRLLHLGSKNNIQLKYLTGIQRLRKAETETSLGHKSDFFFPGGISSGCAAHSDRGTFYRAFASVHQTAQQRVTAGAAANERKVAFLVSAPAHEYAVGLERHSLAVEGDG